MLTKDGNQVTDLARLVSPIKCLNSYDSSDFRFAYPTACLCRCSEILTNRISFWVSWILGPALSHSIFIGLILINWWSSHASDNGNPSLIWDFTWMPLMIIFHGYLIALVIALIIVQVVASTWAAPRPRGGASSWLIWRRRSDRWICTGNIRTH